MLVSGVSEVFAEEFENLTTSSLRTFREEVQGYMQQPPASSTCPELYSLVSYLTPHMGPYMLAQLVQGAALALRPRSRRRTASNCHPAHAKSKLKASLLSKWKAPSLRAVAHHGDQGFPIGMSLCGTLDIAISICVD